MKNLNKYVAVRLPQVILNMSENEENLKKNISRRDFMKIMGAGSLFVGLGALGIPNIFKNIKGASVMTPSAATANTTNALGSKEASSHGTDNSWFCASW